MNREKCFSTEQDRSLLLDQVWVSDLLEMSSDYMKVVFTFTLQLMFLTGQRPGALLACRDYSKGLCYSVSPLSNRVRDVSNNITGLQTAELWWGRKPSTAACPSAGSSKYEGQKGKGQKVS